MSHRDMAACLFAALALAALADVPPALRAVARGGGSLAVLFLGAGILCGLYAALGWAWYLATGVLR